MSQERGMCEDVHKLIQPWFLRQSMNSFLSILSVEHLRSHTATKKMNFLITLSLSEQSIYNITRIPIDV